MGRKGKPKNADPTASCSTNISCFIVLLDWLLLQRHADTQTTRRKDVEMSALAHAFTLREHQDLEMEGSEIRRRCSDGGDLVI
jgi:hypothetical protein